MKVTFLFILLLPVLSFTQNPVSMQDVEGRRAVSMNNANGKTTEGIYRYYVKGEDKPFSGILFAQYPNGNVLSRQEFVQGVGQGRWINYYENGNLKEVGHYEQNLVQGAITKYYPDGQIKAKGTYKDWRIKIGVWEYYDQKGNLKNTKNYGEQGSIEEVQEYYNRGEISSTWYNSILTKNGFEK